MGGAFELTDGSFMCFATKKYGGNPFAKAAENGFLNRTVADEAKSLLCSKMNIFILLT